MSVAAAIVAAALPSVAAGAVVPQSGIAGVSLGQSEAAVREAKGAPVRVLRGIGAFGPKRDLVFQGLTVRFPGRSGGRVVAVSTGVRRQLTATGIGVGSTEAEAEAGIPGLRCAPEGGGRVCSLGVPTGGRTVTQLEIEAGRVSRVTVAVAPKGLSAPGPAARRILPQVGIAGVRLLHGERRVREILGPPIAVRRASDEILGTTHVLVYRGLTVTLPGRRGGQAIAIRTDARRFRTRRGVGVGSLEAAVQRGLHGERCRTRRGAGDCLVGMELPGRTVTRLRIAGGRVTDVLIGIVID